VTNPSSNYNSITNGNSNAALNSGAGGNTTATGLPITNIFSMSSNNPSTGGQFANTNSVIPFSKGQKRTATDKPVRFRSFLNNTILDALKGRGWTEVTEYE
jgi:hypothetical protein